MPIELNIAVDKNSGSIANLHDQLNYNLETLEPGSSSCLVLQPMNKGFRGIDATIIVASIGGGSVVLSAIISGLIAYAKQSHQKMIVMQFRDGQRLEIPADTGPEQVDFLVARLTRAQDETVKILLP